LTGVSEAGVSVADGALSESPEQATRKAERSTTPPTSKPFHVRLPSMLPMADGEFMVFPLAQARRSGPVTMITVSRREASGTSAQGRNARQA
jgi:hypothetical protein